MVVEKSLFCVSCLAKFGPNLKYSAQNKCNPCYQKAYIKNKGGRPKSLVTKCCSNCQLQYGTLDERGKPVKKGPKQMCKKCYTRINKPSKICKECGNEMMNGSNTGLCGACKLKRPTIKGRKPPELPVLEYENFELIRRLLVKYKLGMNNMVDDFRVVDVYLDVKEAPAYLDTLSERSQIVEMLRTLKQIFDYNLKVREQIKLNPPKPKKKTNKDYQKDWYNTSSKSYKNKCKEKWLG